MISYMNVSCTPFHFILSFNFESSKRLVYTFFTLHYRKNMCGRSINEGKESFVVCLLSYSYPS